MYHGVHHGHSYISQSCNVDLIKKIFDESQIGKNITCGKTKSRELAVNVLGELILSVVLLVKTLSNKKKYGKSFNIYF